MKLPGPPLPRLIQLALWMFAPLPLMEACARRYGDTFVLRFPMGMEFVLTSDPAAIRRAFTASPAEYEVRQVNQILRPMLGDRSLLLLDGEHHLHERRLMMPPFHGERMHVYDRIIVDATDAALERCPRGRVFPVHDAMQAITLDVILRAVFGIEDDRVMARLRVSLKRMLDTVAHPISILIAGTGEVRTPWFLKPFERWLPTRGFDPAKRETDDALYEEIARRRADPLAGREDILSMLVEARDESGEGLSDVALRDEMMTLLVAGHETSATALSWAFCHILRDRRVMGRLRAEIDDAVGDDPPAAAHMQRLPYLDACLKETLRLTPILPIVGRTLTGPWTVGDRMLPAGASLAPCIYLTHRRPDLWPDPTAFRPERFLDDRVNPYTWFPFGGGVRRCLGMAFSMFEMRIILARVLQRMEVQIAPDYRPRAVRRSITLAPSHGAPVVMSALPAPRSRI